MIVIVFNLNMVYFEIEMQLQMQNSSRNTVPQQQNNGELLGNRFHWCKMLVWAWSERESVKRLLHTFITSIHTHPSNPAAQSFEVTYTDTKEHLMKGTEWGQFQKQKDVYVFYVVMRLHEPFFYFDLDHCFCVLPDLHFCPWAALNCDLSWLTCAGPILRFRALCGRPLGCTSTGSKMISVSGCSRRGISVNNRSRCQCPCILWRGMWTCCWHILSKSWANGNPCAERKIPLHCENGCDSFLNFSWILLSA